MAALALETTDSVAQAESARTRFDHLELEEKLECDQAQLLLFAEAGVVDEEEMIRERVAPPYLVPQTVAHVEQILKILDARRLSKKDLDEQYKRRSKDLKDSIAFYEEIVLPNCVPVVLKALPRKADGTPKQQHFEGDYKRLQLRTSSEKVKLQDPDKVLSQMKAWDRELLEIADRMASELNPPDEDEGKRLAERMALIERDLLQLVEAVRLKVTTAETYHGAEQIGKEFPDLSRATGLDAELNETPAMPSRVTVTTVEEYFGLTAWEIIYAGLDAADNETFEATVSADLVESFVANHAPIVEIDPVTSEVIDERPFELLGVVRIPARTTLHCG